MSRRLRILVALIAAVLPACNVTSPSPAPQTWAFLGASTTAGQLASRRPLAWVPLLQESVAADGIWIVNLAVVGATTFNWMPVAQAVPGRPAPFRFNNIEAAMAYKPNVVLLNATNNDLVVGATVDQSIANLLALRAIATQGGAIVVMLSTQPRNLPNAQISQMAQIDSRLRPLFGDCFVDIQSPLTASNGRILAQFDSGDGIHPNDAGHAVIFQRVNALVESGRCIPPIR
jgi:acyl-CoA thioesterase-1